MIHLKKNHIGRRTMTINKKMSIIDKLNEQQKERLLTEINNLKDIVNDVQDTCPIDYHKVINLGGLEYFLAEIFNLELPKHDDCHHTNRWRNYKIKKSSGNE